MIGDKNERPSSQRAAGLKRTIPFRHLLSTSLVALIVLCIYVVGCGQGAPPVSSYQEPRELDANQAAERYDLARDEALGGHTLSRHVGRTDVELQARLDEERNISAASAWTDREAAEVTIAKALRAEHGRIENWIKRGTPRANLLLHYNAGHVIGRSLRQGENTAVDCTRAVIVLRARGDGFYVLTAYPEAG